MSPISEVDAIRALEDALSQVQDPQTRDRVLKWAWDKYSSRPSPAVEEEPKKGRTKKAGRSSKKATAGHKPRAKAKSNPSIVKDLNLAPKGKKSFGAFAKDKGPRSNQEKCVVAVYYLHHELAIAPLSIDHVYTCFKDAKWRVPADLSNALAVTAHRKGWLDTTDMENITVTPRGENLVEQDLPPKPKKAS